MSEFPKAFSKLGGPMSEFPKASCKYVRPDIRTPQGFLQVMKPEFRTPYGSLQTMRPDARVPSSALHITRPDVRGCPWCPTLEFPDGPHDSCIRFPWDFPGDPAAYFRLGYRVGLPHMMLAVQLLHRLEIV